MSGGISTDCFINNVRVLEDKDYEMAKRICGSLEGWAVAYSNKQTTVWTKDSPCSQFKLVKAQTLFSDVGADTVYDVLHDPDYRSKWDKYMIKSETIGILNPNNDVCYYAMYAISPVKSRDMVMQRSWLDMGEHKIICGYSVCHDDYPPNKNHVRCTVYLTVYLVEYLGNNQCKVTYMTHADPKGRLPSWLINRATTMVAPKMFKKLHQACLTYSDWKTRHNPGLKPWRFPEQLSAEPRINPQQCRVQDLEYEFEDESGLVLKDEDQESI